MIEYQLKAKQAEPTTFDMSLSVFRVVFMGTPEFAVGSLDALLGAGFNIVGVVTGPDKPAGRGMKLSESAVKKYAQKHGLRVLQPEKLKSPEFIAELRSLNADLQVIVAFRMLPDIVWGMPEKGTVNLHASLLPQYRGAAPINWAIINGETETGVTTFKLQHEIDTGNILLQEKIPIGETETAGELHDRLMEIGARVLVETVKGLATGTLQETPQLSIGVSDPSTLRPAPKIRPENCRIDWARSIDEIHNMIRGLSPYPASFTELGDKILKVFRSEKEPAVPTSRIGRWETDRQSFLKFAARDGYLHLKEVQLEGKKRMNIEDFLRGYRF